MKKIIEKMDYENRGITYDDGKIVFVDNALLNEEVEIEIYLEKDRLKEAKITSIIKPNSCRINPECKYYDKCGGCNTLHANDEFNLEYKKNLVIESLSRSVDLSDVTINDPISFDGYNYRNKIRLHVKDGVLGLYEKNSKNIVEIDECIMANESINNVLKFVKENIDLSFVDEITIRSGQIGDLMLILECSKYLNEENLDKLIENEDITSLVIKTETKNDVYKNSYIYEKVGSMIYQISPDSFFQINSKMTENLYNIVKENIDETDKHILDLYCGCGTIGLFVAEDGTRLTGIEMNKNAIKDAKKNRVLNYKKADFQSFDVTKFIYKLENKYDVVIVDPPRKGLGSKVCESLLKIGSNKIIYISCNPITLAKDLKELTSDYKLDTISMVDMFKGTSHIETVCTLIKK